ncbi:Ig-like domain-containing protein, partial [Alcanivorax sp. 1008]|uniref:Ig-like domain-containing protein n=1 Tax=Alcanivorax sp. 1008 TaxID=2816853 RepID=UPI001D50C765
MLSLPRWMLRLFMWMIGLFTLQHAVDGGGGTETPINKAPEVTFTTPLSGARLNAGDDIHVVTRATDSDGSIVSVVLSVNGTKLRTLTKPPFEWGVPRGSHDALLRNVAAGNYELIAVAQDNQGAESRAVLSLRVAPPPAPPPPPVIKTCDENPSLDRSCTDGSVGTEADDRRALPLAPAIKRDIHLVEVGDGARTDPDNNTRDEGYFTRPHIPPYRTTADGRIAMQTRTRTKDPTAEVFRFFLFEPKRINTSFLSSPPGSATNGAGMDIVANRGSYALPRHRFVASEAAGESESLHSAICNDPGKPMTTCGQGGKNDCHHFSVITPF